MIPFDEPFKRDVGGEIAPLLVWGLNDSFAVLALLNPAFELSREAISLKILIQINSDSIVEKSEKRIKSGDGSYNKGQSRSWTWLLWPLSKSMSFLFPRTNFLNYFIQKLAHYFESLKFRGKRENGTSEVEELKRFVERDRLGDGLSALVRN